MNALNVIAAGYEFLAGLPATLAISLASIAWIALMLNRRGS